MKFKSFAAAAVIAAAAGLAFAPAASAMPAAKLPAQAVPAAQSDVVKVGHRGRVSASITFRSGYAYYNGHRGYHRYRRGYRKYGGYYFHPRAFIVIAPRHRHIYVPRYRKPHPVRPRIVRLNHAHVRWCDAKYRSYRHSDNTFQPYHGPRKQCVSPYY